MSQIMNKKRRYEKNEVFFRGSNFSTPNFYKHLFILSFIICFVFFTKAAEITMMPTGDRLSSERGTVSLEFFTDLDIRSGNLKILNFISAKSPDGRVDIGLTCGKQLSYLRFYLGDKATQKDNVGVYRPAKLTPGQWHQLKFGWTPGRIFISVDDKIIGSFNKRFPLHWGSSVKIGDSGIPGRIRNLKFSPECLIKNTDDYLQLDTNKKGMIYVSGTPIKIIVKAIRDIREYKSGFVTLRYLNDDGTELKRERINLSKGNIGKIITLNHPGFLRVEAVWEKTGLKKEIVIAFSPEKIIGARIETDDVYDFWKTTFAKHSKVPEQTKIIPAPEFDTPTQKCFRIQFTNINNTNIYGFLGIPIDKTRRYPALVIIPGAGPGVQSPRDYFQEGVINLFLNVHAYDATNNANNLAELYKKAYGDKDYCFHGMTGAKDYFFYRVIVGFSRAMGWLMKHQMWDGQNLGITGSSQGGGLSLILAGLHPKVTHLAANIPALDDHFARKVGRRPAWPDIAGYTGNNVPKWFKFYDTINFTGRIKADFATVIVGYLDQVCPPAAVYAAFNAIPSTNKRIINELDMHHEWPSSYGQAIQRMVKDMITKNHQKTGNNK